MRVLITGITGFVGSHMTDYLLDKVKDIEIYATRRWRSKEDNIKHLFGDDRVIFEECDLLLLWVGDGDGEEIFLFILLSDFLLGNNLTLSVPDVERAGLSITNKLLNSFSS